MNDVGNLERLVLPLQSLFEAGVEPRRLIYRGYLWATDQRGPVAFESTLNFFRNNRFIRLSFSVWKWYLVIDR